MNKAAALQRLKRRHAAETRLKAYGIFALLLALLALAALLFSVVSKAGLALSEHVVTTDLAEGEDYEAAWLASVPVAEGRAGRKAALGLLSSSPLTESDRTGPVRLLLSDNADLHLKSGGVNLVSRPAAGALTLEGNGAELAIVAEGRAFEALLAEARSGLNRDIDELKEKADQQERGAQEFQRRAAELTGAARTEAEEEAAKRAAKRDKLLAEAGELALRATSLEGSEELTDELPSILVKAGGGWLKLTEISATSAKVDMLTPVEGRRFEEGAWSAMTIAGPERGRDLSDQQIATLELLKDEGRIERRPAWGFLLGSDSREAELAGILGAAAGSFWTMLVTFLLAFPTGILAAIYLEEFAPKGRMTDFIEVNINNLAAVPSIVFGLLGLAFCLNFLGIPRSAPLAGGIVLALMTLPTVIIAGRTAIRAVPPSIRDAALGVGASELQSAFHHVLPLAMPGILTGTIIGMARALGETAPLIMIGMVAFIVDVPTGILDSATVLPVQIYRWSDFPEQAFEARTALAIVVLLLFLIAMNAVAVILRNRFERRW
jgi:phosphate transport system permease protein